MSECTHIICQKAYRVSSDDVITCEEHCFLTRLLKEEAKMVVNVPRSFYRLKSKATFQGENITFSGVSQVSLYLWVLFQPILVGLKILHDTLIH